VVMVFQAFSSTGSMASLGAVMRPMMAQAE
jgi:hypothetical protein